MSFFQELKRRNVFRVAIAYLTLAWLLIEVSSTLFSGFGVPDWAFRFVVIVLVLGFVPALIISWAYEITSKGLKREREVVRDESIVLLTAKRLDTLTIGLIVVALVFIMVDRAWLGQHIPAQATAVAEIIHQDVGEPQNEPELPTNSIAVLPFANRSANPDDVYFVDGIHDDLLTFISQIGSIKTISRTSVMQYRDTTKPIRQIASELEVTTVLEGGVQRAGEQVRINVQLIDAQTDDHLWAQIYDRELTATNIFAIQSEIAESIADALRTTLTTTARNRITSVPTENLEALEAYFIGRQSMATRTASDLVKAGEHFEAAVAMDPNFALAWVGLADTYLLLAAYAELPWEEMLAKSQAAAEHAMRLDPSLGEAYAADAKRKDWDGDQEGAEAAFKRAVQLNPNYAPAYQWYGEMLGDLDGRITEALELSRKAIALDPKSAIINNDYAEVLESAGKQEEALAQYQLAVEIEPRFAHGYFRIGILKVNHSGQLDEALLAFRKSLSIEPDDWRLTHVTGLVYLGLGDLQQAESWRDRTLAVAPEGVVPGLVVDLHVYRGEVFAALDYARKDLDFHPRSLGSLRVIRDHGLRNGDFEEARDRFKLAHPELFEDNALNVEQGNREVAVDLAYLLLQTGKRVLAEHLLGQVLASIASNSGNRDNNLDLLEARVHAVRGDRLKALAALQQAVDQGWRWYAWYFLKQDPVLKLLHGEAEFQAMKQDIEADISAQLARVREWEANGELPPAARH